MLKETNYYLLITYIFPMLDSVLVKPYLLTEPQREHAAAATGRTDTCIFSKWHQLCLAQEDVLSALHACVHSKFTILI